jgi:hypothetical protein
VTLRQTGTYSPRELYEFIRGLHYGKVTWIADAVAGKFKRPDHEIDRVRGEADKLAFMLASYEAKWPEEAPNGTD